MKNTLLTLACFGAINHVYALDITPDLKKIKDSGVLNIGVRTNAPPFSLYNDGAPQGYVVDLCNTIATNLQKDLNTTLKVQYVPVTTADRFELIDNGKVDIECGTTTVTKARREKADFSYNTFITSTNFVTLAQNKVRNTRDFYAPLVEQKKKVALMKGSAHEEWVKNWVQGAKLSVVYVDNIQEGIKQVHSGQAYLFIQDKVLIQKAMNDLKLNKNQFFFSSNSISIEPYSIMVKKGNKGLLSYVNSELRTYYKSGNAKINMEKYFQPNGMTIDYLNNDMLRTPSTENAVP